MRVLDRNLVDLYFPIFLATEETLFMYKKWYLEADGRQKKEVQNTYSDSLKFFFFSCVILCFLCRVLFMLTQHVRIADSYLIVIFY